MCVCMNRSEYRFRPVYIRLRYREVPLQEAQYVFVDAVQNGFDFVSVERLKEIPNCMVRIRAVVDLRVFA